ncbi:MAG: TonB C-terminal domain-containing protein [Arcobacter sp.]|jgi:hypothetical protein|uniref:Uncharacterized protein n=1 Tax=Arcobacter defluvii TaxID=873191 RepID=A0AAE7BEI5_9BACT|nr:MULTISPECIES: TonB C-terminal domain-containing protein [Arcobacter]MDY3201281.1 TonB C-terminal domain-containing protein [Arcobacter sp.]QKF77623.1 hypothetical protein ADFLV_1601 [Arcobacter defluvii]RXI34402.1 hypothetical protein CP964_03340 [Arcobacter defluvii]BAK73433.1 hypothetical protein ABLL_1558 [Arcobacter sp. L]
MKKVLLIIICIYVVSNLYAREENININDQRIYNKLISDQLSQLNINYKLSIDVNITIDEDGYFSYSILNTSDIEGFNDKLEKFLDEQTRKKFPTFRNQPFTTKITFIPEDINLPSKDKFHNRFIKQ